MGFLDDLYKEHGSDVQQHMSDELGIDQGRAAKILPQVAPIILGGLKRRMEQHGPAQVEQEVNDAAGGIDLDDMAAILRNRGAQRLPQREQQSHDDGSPQQQGGGGIQDLLGMILGRDQNDQANNLMANQLGISPSMAAKIIPMVAPIILAQLMKRGGAAAQRGEAPAQGGGPGGGGGLSGIASILDRNGDGNVLDDLAGLIGGAGGMMNAAGGANKSGCLGSILGSLLGGAKK